MEVKALMESYTETIGKIQLEHSIPYYGESRCSHCCPVGDSLLTAKDAELEKLNMFKQF